MKDALELSMFGIKCDNPNCDYNDMNVKAEDYENWINKPCPKCGANLLTQEDFDNTMMIISFTKMMNEILPQQEDDEEVVNMNIEMNGTGEMNFKIKED